MFLIRNADYTYTSITGINNIDSYVSGEVDYVDVNSDNVADYVYVTALPVDSEIDVLFYYAGGQGSYETATGIYTIPGYIDGVEGNLVTEDGDIYNAIINGADYSLYNVTTVNGLATTVSTAYATGSGGVAVGEMTNNSNYTDYANVLYVTTITGDANDKYGDNLYTDADGYTYVINDNTKLYGEWSADMSNKNVILVWTGGNTNGLVLQAYVVDQQDVPVNPNPTQGTVTYVVNFYNSQNGSLVESRSASVDVNPGTYTYGTTGYHAGNVLPLVDADANAWDVSYCTPSITVAAGGSYTVVMNVYPAN